MENEEYDVVIVGSGIAGSIIAKTLTNAGKRVLLLEAGLNAGIALDGKDAHDTYEDYIQTFYKTFAKAPNSPYPKIVNAQSVDVTDIKAMKDADPEEGYLVQKGPLPFGSDNLRGAGGTMMHWLGTSLRMLPSDFKMRKLYQRGVDWPIDYNDLRPYYEMAEFEIGVSGNVEDQKIPNMGSDFFSNEYSFPMHEIPQSYLDKKIKEKTEGLPITMNKKKYKLSCISTPQGRNSVPNKNYRISGIKWDTIDQKLNFVFSKKDEIYNPVGSLWDPYTGQRCEGNASCVPICPVQAKYNALKTLKKAKRDKLQIITQAVASTLIIDKKTESIVGLRYKKYSDGNSINYSTHIAKGKVYVLAASAIENAKILLASNAANSSDQVGRNLMDHLCLLTWGLFPEKVYPFRGPGSTTNIPTFRDGEFRKNHAAWILPIDNWGWGWPEFSPGTDVSSAIDNGKFGNELREHLNSILAKQVLFHFECEQIPHPENRVTIDTKYKDQIDNYRPVIHYNVSEYELKAFEASIEVWNQLYKANKIINKTDYSNTKDAEHVDYKDKPYFFRGAGHIVGTHRMGLSKEDSVVDENGKTWDHENLFLVGCGNMPTIGTSNPTLTMAALTFKTAEAILQSLEN